MLVAASNKIRKELGWVPQFPHVRAITMGPTLALAAAFKSSARLSAASSAF
jgi:hypothetical protein